MPVAGVAGTETGGHKGQAGVHHKGRDGAGAEERRGEDAVEEAARETEDDHGDASGVGRAEHVLERRGDFTDDRKLGPMMFPSNRNATTYQTLDETLLLYVMVASSLGLMVLAEYLGSSYFLGALLCGLVFGVSGYAASVWSARTCNIVSWVDVCTFACRKHFLPSPFCADEYVVCMLAQLSLCSHVNLPLLSLTAVNIHTCLHTFILDA